MGHCSRETDKDYLATVNSAVISTDDFQDNYFNTILYGNSQDSPKNRKQHLHYLINTYVLAQHGISTGHIDQADVEKVRRRMTRREIKKELFRLEIEEKTPAPGDSDLKRLFSYNNQKLHARHLFAKSRSEIDSIYQLLKEGTDFSKIAYDTFEDSVLKLSGGDLGWNTLGDLDPFLEDTLYQMPTGRYSRPVQSRFGWHILKLENRAVNPLLTESDFVQAHQKLALQYRKREQDKLYYRFINNFMDDKTATIHNPQWSIVMREIRRQYPPDQQLSPVLMQLPHSPEIKSSSPTIQDILDDPIISFPDHEMTVAEFLDWVTDQPVKSLYGNLEHVTEEIIKDYFLVQEGFRRGLENSPNVVNSVDFETTLFGGLKYRNMLLSESLPDPENLDSGWVRATYDSLKTSRYILEQTISYAQLVVADSMTMTACNQELREKVPFTDIIKRHGISKSGVLESGLFTKSYKKVPGPIRQTLARLEDKHYSDWMTLNNRYVLVKRHSIETTYRPLEDVSTELRYSLARNIARSAVNDSLTKWRNKADIQMNTSRLDSLFTN